MYNTVAHQEAGAMDENDSNWLEATERQQYEEWQEMLKADPAYLLWLESLKSQTEELH